MPSAAFLRGLFSRLDHELAVEKAPSANLSPSLAGSWGASWGCWGIRAGGGSKEDVQGSALQA